MKDRNKAISRGILEWSKKNPRSLPWKEDRNPYKIWISEIILQQTRVIQGIPYYINFLNAFPSIRKLAEAKLDQVYKVWEGLGYYRRARHMHESAQFIMERHQGVFPNTYEEILALKGVGPYTAAAIASFAFGLPYPVVDGNVSRVVARLFEVDELIDQSEGRKKILQHTRNIFSIDQPAKFNQGIMDFGATFCAPTNPLCHQCDLNELCESFRSGRVAEIPKKKPRKKQRKRYFFYVILNDGNDLWIKQRTDEDIWQNLYEFLLLEGDQPLSWTHVQQDLPISVRLISLSNIYQQTLTHQKIYATFAEVESSDENKKTALRDYKKIRRDHLRKFAFPKIIDCYLRDKSVLLNLAF